MAIYSVSQFVDTITNHLAATIGSVVVQGEVTGFRVAKDKLVYFELKDATARVLCFALTWELDQPLTDGMEVQVLGTPKLFKASGGFHLRVESVSLVGEGALRRAFELTKEKLAREGLFEAARKKPLPRFPDAIGIVTSRDAAAFTDVVRVSHNRWPGVALFLTSTAVQGIGAAREIARAIRWWNEQAEYPVDALIVTRGGGSLEDLQAFNSEEVCRAIFSSRIPVVCGVGHERDVTLAELVADVRASTPSNAAERSVPDRRDIEREISQYVANLEYRLRNAARDARNDVERMHMMAHRFLADRMRTVRTLLFDFSSATASFEQRLRALQQRAVQNAALLQLQISMRVNDARARVTHFARLLKNLGPEATLRRGYTITLFRGTPLRSSRSLRRGDEMVTRFSDGAASSVVK